MENQERPISELLSEVNRITDIIEIEEMCRQNNMLIDREKLESMTEEELKKSIKTHKESIFNFTNKDIS